MNLRQIPLLDFEITKALTLVRQKHEGETAALRQRLVSHM